MHKKNSATASLQLVEGKQKQKTFAEVKVFVFMGLGRRYKQLAFVCDEWRSR